MAKSSTSHKRKRNVMTKQVLPRWAIGLIIAVPVLVAAVIGLLTGYPQFFIAKIGCGHDPVILDSGQRLIFNETPHYILPYPGEPLYRVAITNKYYCTEQQAQASGATIHPYSRVGIQRGVSRVSH